MEDFFGSFAKDLSFDPNNCPVFQVMGLLFMLLEKVMSFSSTEVHLVALSAYLALADRV